MQTTRMVRSAAQVRCPDDLSDMSALEGIMATPTWNAAARFAAVTILFCAATTAHGQTPPKIKILGIHGQCTSGADCTKLQTELTQEGQLAYWRAWFRTMAKDKHVRSIIAEIDFDADGTADGATPANASDWDISKVLAAVQALEDDGFENIFDDPSEIDAAALAEHTAEKAAMDEQRKLTGTFDQKLSYLKAAARRLVGFLKVMRPMAPTGQRKVARKPGQDKPVGDTTPAPGDESRAVSRPVRRLDRLTRSPVSPAPAAFITRRPTPGRPPIEVRPTRKAWDDGNPSF